ncbi:MAG: Cna B-type domain-containing protein, partial [Streptococcus minor]|nr:Cna B-type domain-containing protein [Streptococcus minor]
MKKIFTAFLAFFLAFSPLLTVSPTVYSEAFDQTTATSEEQATTESGTTTKEAENGPEIPPIISSPPATEATTITEAPQPAGQEDTSTATESTTTESKPAVQPRSVFRNAVRSVPTTTNLSDLLADATVDAPIDSEGNYIVRPNGEYTISLQFAEKETLQMVNDQPLTYTVPAGFKLADVNNTFSIDIKDSQGTATLDGNTFNVTNNVLTVNFNKTNPELFNRLSAMANVKFKLDFSGRFTGDVTEINFGSSIKKKFTFDQTSSLSITKEAEHVKSEGKAKYTLKVTSEGNNSEVVITDEIKGTALTPNNNVEVTSSISGKLNVAPAYAGKKFTLSNLSLQHGEILTITYSADINYNDITRTGLPEEVNNLASVQSKENPTPKTVEKPVRVEFDSITKTGTVPQKIPNEPNKYKVVWTATINKDRLMTVGGNKIIDYVSPAEKVHFTGDGIVINVTKDDGSQEVRNLSWSQLTVTRRAGDREIFKWEYTPPVEDGKAMYVITTTTIADITGAIGNFNFNNNISIGKRVTTPNKIIDVGIGEDLKPKKEIVSYTSTEALWKITVPVRGEGYNVPVKVTDDLPYVDYKGVKYQDDPLDIEFQGLLPGESYALVMRTDGQYRGPYIEFFQDAEKKIPGLLPNPNGQRREIVILLKSTINQDWLELAHQSGYSTASSEISPVHRNNASLRLGTSLFSMNASITPKKQTLKKTYKDFKRVDIGGVQYPVFSYELEFTNPLDGQVITDEFDVDYLKYYQAGTLEIKGRNAEGDEFDTNGTVTPQVTAKGVNFTLTNLPKNNGNYYTTYRLTYDLIVKDAQTLEKLNKEAFQNENNQGKVLNNIASWNGLRSENVSTIYNYNPKLDKKLIQVPSNANSYVATFELILNEEAADLFSDSNTYTAKDELSNVLRLLPETIQVTKGTYTLDYGFDAKTNTITFNNIPDGQEVRIVYSAHVLGSGNVSFANAVSMGQYRKVVSESVHIASSGSGSASNPSITIVKHDKDEFSKVIPGVTFKLSYSKNGLVEDVKDKNGQVVTFTTKADGSFLIEGNQTDLGWVLWADGRTYLLTEVNTPTGYLPLEQPISFTILETPTNTSQYPITGGKIYVANERPKTRVEATKIWKNIGPGLAVPTTWFKLFRQVEGGPLEPVPNASIMTLAPGTTSVAWENVYAKDLNNKPYTFFVKEVDANGHEATPQDYLKEENGLQVTNTYDGRKEIEVTKEWDDNNNQDGKRPSEVTVHLYADGTKIQTAQITEANGWRHTFSNLPKFKDGREIVYTIQEDQVPEYKAPVIDGFTVKNKRTPEKTKVAVQKVWQDANNQDGIRPLQITVILKANGLEIDRKVITAGPLGVWSHEFTNLDVYKNGVKVNYTVDEEVVPADYSKTITGDAATGFTITNSHTPVEKNVTFSKVNLGGQEIAGAKIKIYKGTVATGTPVAEWTSVEGQSHELSLPVGKYVFHEEAAPNGYVAVTDITFQVNYNGTVTVLDANSNTVEYRNGKLVITDKYDESPKKITFSKVNLGGDEVEGAEVEIYKGDTITGSPIEKWTSGTTPKELNLAPGTYVFHEEAAPEGLLKVTDITFKVNYDGTVVVTNIGEKDAKGEMNTVVTDGAKITITDKTDDLPRKITFSKVNLGGDEVEGAEVEIYKGDTITGAPVEKWTSGTTPKELNLAPGTYVFHEEAAPEGLLKVTDITFKVNYDG